MRVAGIVRDSVVDGTGVRDVIFVQGCPHKCLGCHNPDTWNAEGGEYMAINDIAKAIADSSNNVTISGGEPMKQFIHVRRLVNYLRSFQGKTAWLYTGYRFEDYMWEVWADLCKAGVTVVVDGRFEQDKKDSNLRFRGSSNQRIIDLVQTMKRGEIVLWDDEE